MILLLIRRLSFQSVKLSDIALQVAEPFPRREHPVDALIPLFSPWFVSSSTCALDDASHVMYRAIADRASGRCRAVTSNMPGYSGCIGFFSDGVVYNEDVSSEARALCRQGSNIGRVPIGLGTESRSG